MSLNEFLKNYGIFDETKYRYIHIDGEITTYICDVYGNIYNTRRKGHGYNKVCFKKLKQIKMPNDYYVVTLSINGICVRDYVHRLVAKEFIEIPKKYIILGYSYESLEVNHKNGDKSDNSVFNLEWTTDSDNKIHGYKNNLYKYGEDSCKAIYTNSQIHMVCKLLEDNELKPSEISLITGVSVGQIHDIKNKGSWTHISNLYDFRNYTPKQRKYSDDQLNTMWEMINSGKYTPREISNSTGINIKSIYSYKSKN